MGCAYPWLGRPHPELIQLALEGSIRWDGRGYETADLDGALIAIAATDDTDDT